MEQKDRLGAEAGDLEQLGQAGGSFGQKLLVGGGGCGCSGGCGEGDCSEESTCGEGGCGCN